MCKEKEIKGVLVDCEGINEETHPFNNPNDLKGAKYLFVGTFPPRRFYTKELEADDVDWFYGSKDNEFWGANGKEGLIQSALGFEEKILDTKKAREDFCKDRGIAFLDLFQVIKRYGNLASDSYIFPIEITKLVCYLQQNSSIETIFFTSEWVMDIAKKEYLRVNQKYLKELYLRKNKKEKEGDIDYVANNCFYLESRDNKDETMEKQQGVKLIQLLSPSSFAKTASKNKLIQWQEAFSQGGLLKKQ